jgi:HEAT repeat protein
MRFVPKYGVDELLLQLQEDDASRRLDALALLGDLGDDAEVAVPAVIAALRDENPLVRKMAVLTLGDIGPCTAEVVGALIEALCDVSPAVRRRAAITLGILGCAAAVQALQDTLRDEDDQVRKAAVQALDEFDPGMTWNAA